MINFVLHQIKEISGKIKIFKLSIDGFIIYKSLPETKFKELRGCYDAYTEYELKTRNLRVYLFKEEKTGSIILWGGKKNTQAKDISTFRKIKRSYIENKKLK